MILFFTALVFLFGLAIGSFLNVVILRTRQGKKLGGRSECPYCHHQLAAIDLFPVFSYLSLRGKCRYCQHKLSLQYPLVEFTTALAFSLVFLERFQSLSFQLPLDYFNLYFYFFVFSILIAVSVYDFKWGIIPDKFILPASVIAFIYQLLLTFFLLNTSTFSYLNLAYNLLTSLGIGLFFFVLILVTRGKGMGGGDFKLSIFIGLSLGWPLAILAIFLGFLTGAIGSVMLIMLGRKSLKQTVPFGPFLALGGFLALTYGNQILELYLKSMGFQ